MPNFHIQSPSGNRSVRLVKPLTTVGGDGADISVALKKGLVEIAYDGRVCIVSAIDGAPLLINNRRRDTCELVDGDVVSVGDATLLYSATDAAPAPISAPKAAFTTGDLSSLRRLYDFSKELAEQTDLPKLLAALLDRSIAVTLADKGFLLLIEDGRVVVKVARNLAQEHIRDAVEQLSDSIVAKVVRTGAPVIVSDALHDREFNASASVIDLKVCSVMCVPLAAFGNILGAIYVANDSVVNLFEERGLEVLTIFAAQAALLVKNALLVQGLQADNADLKRRLDDAHYGDIIGSCEAMRDVYKKIDKIAQTDISVLITGETGTGKELIAREIHRRSTRKNGPFITINCGAIPEALLESELFGHLRGAFTGAVTTRPGKFQAANGGTLFLDEIGEMPAALQVKILRALQERSVTKIGETRPESVDIRVLAATNKILEEEIKTGRFREDLYYRLNVVKVHLPPLRDRGEDIVVLAKFFLGRAASEFGAKVRGYSPTALIAMRKYAWPGNIRQLENRIKKAAVMADAAVITPEDMEILPEHMEPIMPLAQAKEEWQRRYVNEILERNNGNRTKTAKDLAVDPRTIFRHLERMEADAKGEPGEEPIASGEDDGA